MKKYIRLIHNTTEEHVVVASGDALDAFREDNVNLTFYWEKCLPYTISLPLVSEMLREKIYPKESA